MRYWCPTGAVECTACRNVEDCTSPQAKGEWVNQGCGILDESPLSFGAGFNAHGGGVIATVWDASGALVLLFLHIYLCKEFSLALALALEVARLLVMAYWYML